MLQCIPVEDSSEVATPVLADDCEEMAIDEERQELPLADVTPTDMKATPEENIELTDQFFILSERSAVTECVDEETRKDEEHTEVSSPKEQMAHAEDTRNSSDPEESEHKVFDHKDKLTHRRILNRKMNGLLCVVQSMRKDIKPAYGGKKRNLEKLKKKISLGLTVLDAMQFHLLLSEDTIAS
ncbi:uncharacterized protein LOC106159318 [Lingula anatina]|uniref:Uncharacterized protein LOC106159318 n=1 Tax=Lingula anatina TaxID=7574 RepID=A0A1S3HYD0_LINAN|nr:uncharacterized protein LOC106159318 [Lingula anatina]|eukprot:XP_013391032.1 uncharacterized protein LOC106159318 [Lingula anatina]